MRGFGFPALPVIAALIAGSLLSGPAFCTTLRFVTTTESVDAESVAERVSRLPDRDRAFAAIREEGGRVAGAIRSIVAPHDPQAREIWSARGVTARLSNDQVDLLSDEWPSLRFETIDSTAVPVSGNVDDTASHLTPPAWNHVMCGSWDLSRLRNLTGKGVMVAVIGPDVPFDHPAIAERIIAQRTFGGAPARGTEDLMLLHPLGLLAGKTDDKTIGTAPDVSIALATLPRGKVAADDLLSAIQWALEPIEGTRPVAVLLAVDFQTAAPRAIRDALAACKMAGILPILPAGNTPSRITGMAALPDVLTIGALDQWKTRAAFSGCGPAFVDGYQLRKPDYMAPGLAVTGPAAGNTYRQGSGTLQAAAHFAGIWAQIRQSKPDTEIETILTTLAITSRDLGPTGPDNDYGNGLADPLAMLQYLENPPSPPDASGSLPVPPL
ncbi:MAG: Bacillopeptidase F precursor [bacterium ADurb.Bin374]|nr:MAG: Bacillopeptidase F precursor [bacterium ADurb.Bin374]